MIENKLKIISPKIILSTSDSREELDIRKSFSKGGTITALWNDVTNYIELDESTEKQHGW